jgi:hypothetical protein
VEALTHSKTQTSKRAAGKARTSATKWQRFYEQLANPDTDFDTVFRDALPKDNTLSYEVEVDPSTPAVKYSIDEEFTLRQVHHTTLRQV